MKLICKSVLAGTFCDNCGALPIANLQDFPIIEREIRFAYCDGIEVAQSEEWHKGCSKMIYKLFTDSNSTLILKPLYDDHYGRIVAEVRLKNQSGVLNVIQHIVEKGYVYVDPFHCFDMSLWSYQKKAIENAKEVAIKMNLNREHFESLKVGMDQGYFNIHL